MKTKYLIYNYLAQLLLIIGAYSYFKTFNNMFLNFPLAYIGILAGLLSKLTIWVYIILQIAILFVAYKTNWNKEKLILILTICSTPLLGWISIINSIVIIKLIKTTLHDVEA